MHTLHSPDAIVLKGVKNEWEALPAEKIENTVDKVLTK
jgi:hypothetical protein